MVAESETGGRLWVVRVSNKWGHAECFLNSEDHSAGGGVGPAVRFGGCLLKGRGQAATTTGAAPFTFHAPVSAASAQNNVRPSQTIQVWAGGFDVET